MKKISLLSLAVTAATLAACGGDNSPDKANLCEDYNVERCDQVVVPEPSSSSSSSTPINEPPANDLLPFTETFNAADAGAVFSSTYKPLLITHPDDINPAFLYPSSGLAEGRLAVKDNRFTMGNARFTIGQGYDVTGTHIDQLALPANPKVDTTRDGSAAQFPMKDSWGQLDLRHQWKLSFCVENWEHTGSTANNQQFYLLIDNNSSNKGNSIHGNKSTLVELNVDKFTKGKRVEIMVPGTVLSGGVMIDEVDINPGRINSFLQVRVPSSASLTMSNLWMGYQSDTSTEPSADSCTAGPNVDTFNKPMPPLAPVSLDLTSQSEALRATWPAAPRATHYNLSVGTVDDRASATQTFTDITDTSFTIPNLVNGTTYYVWINAVNAQGASEWSASFSAVPNVPATAPDVVTNLKGYGDDRRALLVWDANEAAESYKVYQGTSNDFNAAVEIAAPTNAYHRVKNLVNDTPYYYFITAVNSVGESLSETISVTPTKSASNIYEANFAVTQAQFFDSATSVTFAATPSVQTISLENDQAMALAMAGESRMPITEAGLRIANSRFTIGLAGVLQDNGSYSYTATKAGEEPVGGTLDLSNNYQICYTVVEKHTAGLFRVYLNNTSTTGAASIHGSASRLINQAVADIPLNQEQCVDFVDSKHLGLANSFVLLNVDSNGGEVGVVLSSFKIVDLGTVPNKDLPASSSSSSSDLPESSSSSNSSVITSSNSTSSSTSISSESSSSTSSSDSSSSSSSSSSSAGASLPTYPFSNFTAAFDYADKAAMLAVVNPHDATKPLFRITGGNSATNVAGGLIIMGSGSRFSIGDLTGEATTSTSADQGSFDLTGSFRIVIEFESLSTGTESSQGFHVYLNNNTTSSTNSALGGSSLVHRIKSTDLVEGVWDSGPITSGTANSFLQLRADSSTTANIRSVKIIK